MKRYYTDEGWQRRRRYYEEGPAAEWRDLYRTLSALTGEDPASEPVQSAVDRWLALSIRAYTGDPNAQTDSPTAWADRERWPARMKRRIDEFNLEAVHALVQAAAQAAPKKYFTAGRVGSLHRTTRQQSRVRLARAGRRRVDAVSRHRSGARFRRRRRPGGGAQGAVGRATRVGERRRSRNPCGAVEDVGRSRSLVGIPALASRGDPLDAVRPYSEGCGFPRRHSQELHSRPSTLVRKSVDHVVDPELVRLL